MACQVEVKQGILQGKECVTYYGKKYYSFEGIPYAKPPLGRLRFRNPQEPGSWQGIRDATKPGNKCAQINPYSSTPLEGSEDCLYLNIYTPCLPYEKIQKLPVIFFVHGGRLIFGYGHYYKPDYLLKHDVILVTVNYRLNILGFLCLHLPEAPGNVGIKDTVMALKWVRENIPVFNGDSTNITVFGESAGAAIVQSYVVSEMTRGMFSKVIAQSGTAFSDLYIIENEDPIEKAVHIASNLGQELSDPKSILEFLLHVPINELIFAFTMAELSRHPAIIHAYLSPVIEKKFDGLHRFFTEHPKVTVRENRHHKVPIITGLSSHEAALFLRKDKNGDGLYEDDYNYLVPRALNLQWDSLQSKNFIKNLKEFYFKSKSVREYPLETYVNLISDIYFNKDILYFAECLSKISKDLYFYEFSFPGNMNTRVMQKLGIRGASHGDIIQYQFYRKSKADKCKQMDNDMVDFLNEAWCNFAKHGKPTWSNQTTKWLPYTQDGHHTLVIDKELKLVKDYDDRRRSFWIHVLEGKCKL